jgi:hypothetical protein
LTSFSLFCILISKLINCESNYTIFSFFLHAVLAALPPSSSINTQLASSNFTLSDLVYDVRAVHPVITASIINTTPILSPPPPPENQAPGP